jgi:hypothetical protein
MQKRPASLGLQEQHIQRQAVLRSLTAVNLQIATMTEHIFCLEEQIRRMNGGAAAKRPMPATPLSN